MYPYPKGNFFIPAPHGRLEAIYRPENHRATHVALVLHPHPQHGGTMHNKVVFRAARALNQAGYETLRFNFRGVGHSTGTFDNGAGEAEDTRVALDYLLSKQTEAREVIVAGFSFGSAIGLRVGCANARVTKLIAIGAPVRMYDRSFLLACTKPKLFIHGEKDEIAPLVPIQELVHSLPPENNSRMITIEGAGHFFDDKLDEMMAVVTEFALT
ncbi:MAG TPA: alpha/beta fold hydrolase [Blastocatellia bacterium]|nr:alpha/beta fold hydrolase [Blastocatellia bacterium]